MLIRVIQRPAIEEVKNKIEKYEKELSTTFDEFEELFVSGKLNRRDIDAYFEWASWSTPIEAM